MADPSFDRLMMEASAAAYNVVAGGNGGFTLSGKDATDVAYRFDSRKV